MKKLFIWTLFFISFNILCEDIIHFVPDTTPSKIRAEQNAQNIILNGPIVDSSMKGYQHSVLLKFHGQNGKIGFCSGSIIAHDTILTASHCTREDDTEIEIFFGNGYIAGESHLKRTYSSVRVYKSFGETGGGQNLPKVAPSNPNPFWGFDLKRYNSFLEYFNELDELSYRHTYDSGFSQNNRDDIALIFFRGGLPAGFQAAKWFNGEIPQLKEEIVVYGYGVNSRYMNQNDKNLREGRLKVFAYYAQPQKLPLYFRAFSGNHSYLNVAAGDSGAGAYVEDKNNGDLMLIGITIGVANNSANSAGFNMIYRFSDWVEESMEEFRSFSAI